MAPRTVKAWAFIVLVAALAAAPIACLVAHWFVAYPVPVELRLNAPADAQISLSWDSQGIQSVPFVSAHDTDASRVDLWLAELPPLPQYQLRLDFGSTQCGSAFKELVLINPRDLQQPLFRAGAAELASRLTAPAFSVARAGDVLMLDASAGSKLQLGPIIFPSPRPAYFGFAKVWLLLTVGLSLGGVLVLPLLRPAAASDALADKHHADRHAGGSFMPLWLLVGAGMLFHLAVTANLPTLFNEFDPLVYFHKAVWLLEKGTYDTNWIYWDLDRLPGYPVFLAGCCKLFGYQLQMVSIVQGTLFGLSLLSLALALRPWAAPWITGIAALAALICPMYLASTRSIGTESLFASLTNLSLAAFFRHLGTRGKCSFLWLVVHGLSVTAAVFVRPNGVVLLTAPLAAWMPVAARSLVHGRSLAGRLKDLATWSLLYALPFVLVGVGLCAWATRNYVHHGVFTSTTMVGVSCVEGLIQSGVFEAGCLHEDGLYAAYLRKKHALQYAYTAWDLRWDVEHHITQVAGTAAPGPMNLEDRQLRSIALTSVARAPWQLQVAGWLRAGYWACRLPTQVTYARSLIRWPNVFFENDPASIASWKRFAEVECPVQLGKKLVLDMDNAPKARWAQAYVRCADRFQFNAYAVFLITGLITGAAVLWRGPGGFAVPALVFIANLGFNTWLLNIHGRYILSLETLLIFQTALGIQLLVRSWRNASLKSEESERLRIMSTFGQGGFSARQAA